MGLAGDPPYDWHTAQLFRDIPFAGDNLQFERLSLCIGNARIHLHAYLAELAVLFRIARSIGNAVLASQKCGNIFENLRQFRFEAWESRRRRRE